MAGANGSTQAANVPAPRKEAPIAVISEQSLTEVVGARINEWMNSGEIVLPKDYSVDNAMKFAWLKLQETEDLNGNKLFTDGKLNENIGTKNSVIAALLNMAVQGLNVGKNQGYFVIFARQVNFMRSYFGTETVTKMVQPKVADFASMVIREGDTITYDVQHGKIINLVHKTSWDNRNKPITGAYSIALDAKGEPYAIDIMSIEEIHQSWKQSKAKPFDDSGKLKPSSMHYKFPVESCKKTIINRVAKPIINTSTDKTLLLNMIKKADEMMDEAMVREEVEQAANTGPEIDITAPDKPAITGMVEDGQEKTAQIGAAPEPEQPPQPVPEVQEAPVFEIIAKKLQEAGSHEELNEAWTLCSKDGSLTPDEKKNLSSIYNKNAKRLEEQKKAKQDQPAEEQPDYA